MISNLNNTEQSELKINISQILNDKSKHSKKHPDSLNCLINCSEIKITLHITQKPGYGKDSLFLVQKINNFAALFFYDIPSNQVLDEIQNKNEKLKLLNNNQKIRSENEIIEQFEQNKKNKILLFKYIKFPLININDENNKKKTSTLIILDNGENDIISNFSTNSSYIYHQTCSVALIIENPNNCDFLFSLSDIKDSKEIKIKLSGSVHEQPLFEKEIICYLSPDVIMDSIKKRMEKYKDNEDIEKLKDKYFFVKLNDNNSNNIGILFSLMKNNKNKEIKYDKEYIKSDKYLINKIFLFLDVWLNDANNINTFLSTESSSKSLLNKFEEKNKNNEYSYEFNYFKDHEPKNDYLNDSNIITNTRNNNYFNNNLNYYDYNYSSSNYCFDNYSQSEPYKCDNYFKSNNQNYEYEFDYYYNKQNNDTELNDLFNLVKKVEDNKLLKIEKTADEEKLDMLLIKMQLENNYITSENENKEDIFIQNTLFINMNEEMMRKLFDKYEQDKCISNYTIIKHMLDIDMNIELNNKTISELKLSNFFDIFQNSEHVNINIPFITKKGKLIINSFSPSLSSMILVINMEKERIKKIQKNIKNYEGFSALILEKEKDKNSQILKLEYEEVKPFHERDLLYIKIAKIKNIINDKKISYNDILIKNSYFSVLWSVTNNLNIKSSFLAYYTFDFKLAGVLIINIDYKNWFTPFSYKLDNYKNYKEEYDINVDNVKTLLKKLAFDREDNSYGKFFKYDYYQYLGSNKRKNY